ncbi:DUF4974 domain-containing protein [Algoriphagus aestuariicola]|uniref:DUF4974 domain-containing protein n=1 Tax=Algoriphagus aestuariicola TaxID=1852016 RepID=A0ABS3BLR5_9BACT|nr:FecR family protein [Algoriphagus aestuariicola]MBN7800246.1 DUF4974 domain-containing protein [Algoriphagus aestuariicola]
MSQINDLLENLEFIRWVKNPDHELSTFWKSWMEANPGRIGDVKLAREAILGLQFPSKSASEATKREVLNSILRETKAEKLIASHSLRPESSSGTKGIWQFSRVAAILVGVALLSTLLLKVGTRNQEQPTQTSARWVTKSTNAGEKLNFRLPDQTIVWLNSGSSLEYPETFDSTVRLVKLKGEGFFEVSENPEQPFQVLSDDLITTALGTTFNINITHRNEIHVALVTGKVSVIGTQDSRYVYLDPGQELTYKKTTGESKVTSFSQDQVLGWRFGKLIFNRSTLGEVKEDLEGWYGVEITLVGRPDREWQFNGKFENQTLDNVLKSMSNIENFTYSIDHKTVKLIFN